jgi:hypothetical protein
VIKNFHQSYNKTILVAAGVAWYDGNDEIVLHISAYSVCMIIIPDKLMQKQIKRKPYIHAGRGKSDEQ